MEDICETVCEALRILDNFNLPPGSTEGLDAGGDTSGM